MSRTIVATCTALIIGYWYYPSSCSAFLLLLPIKSGDSRVSRPEPQRLVVGRPFLTVLHDATDAGAATQPDAASTTATATEMEARRLQYRANLLALVKETPSGRATPPLLTRHILDCVRALEGYCPTSNERHISQLAGTWELLWTAQDPAALEFSKPTPALPLSFWKPWINPLENQAYSNNPGQANPFLPVAVQNRLEQAGFTGLFSSPLRSTQSIDIKTGQIRNIVTVQWYRPPRNDNTNDSTNESTVQRPCATTSATLTVLIRFTVPDRLDSRRINVQFDACRLAIPRLSIDWDFPLGLIGPKGWLRTVYLDDVVRVTRGHKGSVFILARPSLNRHEPSSSSKTHQPLPGTSNPT